MVGAFRVPRQDQESILIGGHRWADPFIALPGGWPRGYLVLVSMRVMPFKVRAGEALAGLLSAVVGWSHQIHAVPQVALAEHLAADAVARLMTAHRFGAERNAAGLPTALVAECGHRCSGAGLLRGVRRAAGNRPMRAATT